jgi:hypothetical protein
MWDPGHVAAARGARPTIGLRLALREIKPADAIGHRGAHTRNRVWPAGLRADRKRAAPLI